MFNVIDNKKLSKVFFAICLIVLSFLISSRHSYGAIYKYINREGVSCFTDNRDSIPPEFRKKAVKIKGDGESERQAAIAGFKDTTEKKTEALPDRREEVKPETKDMTRFFSNIADNRIYKAAIAFGMLVIAFIGVGKIGESTGHRNLSSVLRIVVVAGLLIFLYDLYSKETVNVYNSIKDMAFSAKDMSENRDRKTTETINDMFQEQKKEQ